MVNTLVTGEDCSNCRYCCSFTAEDIWEMKFRDEDVKNFISVLSETHFKKTEDGKYVFDTVLDKYSEMHCPALSERGCILGEKKPFLCKLYPMMLMRDQDKIYLVAAKECSVISRMTQEEIVKKTDESVIEEARKFALSNPEMIEEMRDGFVIITEL